MTPSTVAIVGTGLIGGSIGLGLKDSWADATIVGYDVDPRALAVARQRGAVDRESTSVADAARTADLIVLALPVEQIPHACDQLRGRVGEIAVVTDVGSAKAVVVAQATEVLGANFVGGHPMAGSERRGIEAADAALFEGAHWILTPTERTSAAAYGTVSAMAAALGAEPVAVDVAVHDSLVARLSHLPQVVASALVEVAINSGNREALLGLAGGGFRDVTRIAASDPDLWVGIVRANVDEVLASLEVLRTQLGNLRSTIEGGKWDELRDWLERSRRARVELFAKPEYGKEPVALAMLVPDRPGVLAEVTTAAGQLGANIEDLRIVHSTEGGRGRLELVVAGREPAELLTAALIKLGYHVHRTQIN